MKITLEPSAEITTFITPSGAKADCRLWKGADEHGVPVHAFIVVVSPQTHDEAANNRFIEELREVGINRQPGVYDLRFFVD